MALEVGINTYFDIVEANEIVENELYDDSVEYEIWEKMSDRHKEQMIRKTTAIVDKLLFIGLKVYTCETPLSFPRIINNRHIEVTYDIKVAIIMQGLKEKAFSNKEEIRLQDLGVKSYSIDGASISFNETKLKMKNGIYKDIFETYLTRYVY